MKKFIILSLVIISACSTVRQQNGAELRQVKLDQINSDSVKGDVYNLLGSPSTKSVYGEETWYYITSRTKKQLIRDDKIINQSIVAISFNPNDTVDNIEVYDENSRREFASSDRVTPTAGRQLNVFEQLLGNIGKFNTDKSDTQIGSRSPGGGARSPY